MSSGLDWERFGVITGGDEVCILPPPTLSEKGVGIPTLSISPKKKSRCNDRGVHLLTVDIWEQPLSVGPCIFLCEANEE